MELRLAKNEFSEKEEELARAFVKVESLLDELNNLHERSASCRSVDQQQEIELDKLRQELEVLTI